MYREPFYPLMFDGKRFIKTLTHLLMYRCGRLVGSAGTRQFTAEYSPDMNILNIHQM